MEPCRAAASWEEEEARPPRRVGAGRFGNRAPAPPIPPEMIIESCDCVLDIAAAFFNVPGRELRRSGRCPDNISRVRQIAMYVAHVVLRLSMADVGKGFGRDRTTVMHACHTIEDMRDDADADEIVLRMERVVAAAFRGHRLYWIQDAERAGR